MRDRRERLSSEWSGIGRHGASCTWPRVQTIGRDAFSCRLMGISQSPWAALRNNAVRLFSGMRSVRASDTSRDPDSPAGAIRLNHGRTATLPMRRHAEESRPLEARRSLPSTTPIHRQARAPRRHTPLPCLIDVRADDDSRAIRPDPGLDATDPCRPSSWAGDSWPFRHRGLPEWRQGSGSRRPRPVCATGRVPADRWRDGFDGLGQIRLAPGGPPP